MGCIAASDRQAVPLPQGNISRQQILVVQIKLSFLSLLSDDASRCSFPTPEALQLVINLNGRMKGDFYTR